MRVPEVLLSLTDQGVIDEVVRPLKSGKEAQVYLVRVDGEPRVAKVYKDAEHRSFKQRAQYTEGRRVRNTRDQRAIERHTRHGKTQEEERWKSAEVDVIHRLHAYGVRVPTPYNYIDGVLIMELVRDEDGHPAPRLGELDLDRDTATAYFDQLLKEVVKMLCAGIVHGDLSDYNVLVDVEGPVIIDFPQSVDASQNRNARQLLVRDVDNLSAFLARCVPNTRRQPYGQEIWAAYESNLLTPDLQLTGSFRRSSKPTDMSSLLEHIEEADSDERVRREKVAGVVGVRPRKREVIIVPAGSQASRDGDRRGQRGPGGGQGRNASGPNASGPSAGGQRNQSSGGQRNQSSGGQRNQSAGGQRNQSAGGQRNQSAGGQRNQSAGGQRNQSAGDPSARQPSYQGSGNPRGPSSGDQGARTQGSPQRGPENRSATDRPSHPGNRDQAERGGRNGSTGHGASGHRQGQGSSGDPRRREEGGGPPHDDARAAEGEGAPRKRRRRRRGGSANGSSPNGGSPHGNQAGPANERREPGGAHASAPSAQPRSSGAPSSGPRSSGAPSSGERGSSPRSYGSPSSSSESSGSQSTSAQPTSAQPTSSRPSGGAPSSGGRPGGSGGGSEAGSEAKPRRRRRRRRQGPDPRAGGATS